jgi:teichuronic acid biosynthesis glycosyltransferase TuaG
MQNNLVSIITPSYNSKNFIKETIDSVLAQTYPNWEMIIVDDKSNDESVTYIENLIKNETRIKLLPLNENVGAAMARNKALAIAKGKYIAFLDSDDVWFAQKLEEQLTFMQTHNYAFTFASYIPFSEDGTVEYKKISVPSVLDYAGYCKNTIIGCLTVVIDKDIVGDFRMPNIRSSHDMALWLLIMKRGFKAYGLNEVLGKYRLVSTSNTSKKYKAAKEVWDVYRKVEKLSLFKSTWYFINYVYNALKKRKQ